MATNYNHAMQSLWNNSEAASCGSELALRAYTSRLLGADPSLVLHGGGNTSLKLPENGGETLYVKGTGSDLAHVDEHAFTPLDLPAVRRIFAQDCPDNFSMMSRLDACAVRRPAPRPSIETLMHAGLPYQYVEHTHADAVLATLNIDSIEAVHAKVYGSLAPLIPYHHSGHTLARACVRAYGAQRKPNTIGLILAFHGVVAFGDDARESYENMIRLVTLAEDYLKSLDAWELPAAEAANAVADTAELQRVHAEVNAAVGQPLAIYVANDAQCLAFARRADLAEISLQGPATPQHAVYTKNVPMLGRDVRAYTRRYRNYLDTHLGRDASALIDAAPRIMVDAEFGLVAFGTDARTAKVAAEMYRHDIAVISRASAHGRYCSAPPAAIAQAEYEYGGYAARQRMAPT